MKKFYISGPISGLDHAVAFANFERAEGVLRGKGLEPVNPMKTASDADGKTWEEYMREDIKILMDCDGIYMLEDWPHSRGARIEYELAVLLDFQVIDPHSEK